MDGAGATESGTAQSRVRRWNRICLDFAFGAMAFLLAQAFLVQVAIVRGHSMEPSIQDGDRLLVDRVSPVFDTVARGSVIVLRCPLATHVDFVKRVVGVPGDHIAMEKGSLLVNGTPLDHGGEDVILDATSFRSLLVPEGHYFVLGDNRPDSCDSREFGLVAAELVKGTVRARFWPLAYSRLF